MNLKKIVLLAMLVIGSASVFASGNKESENDSSKDIRENGELMVLEGVLSSKDGGTYIQAGIDSYEVLRSPRMFSYTDGTEVVLEGYVYEMQMKPTKITIDGIEKKIEPPRKGRRGHGKKENRDKGEEREIEDNESKE